MGTLSFGKRIEVQIDQFEYDEWDSHRYYYPKIRLRNET